MVMFKNSTQLEGVTTEDSKSSRQSARALNEMLYNNAFRQVS